MNNKFSRIKLLFFIDFLITLLFSITLGEPIYLLPLSYNIIRKKYDTELFEANRFKLFEIVAINTPVLIWSTYNGKSIVYTFIFISIQLITRIAIRNLKLNQTKKILILGYSQDSLLFGRYINSLDGMKVIGYISNHHHQRLDGKRIYKFEELPKNSLIFSLNKDYLLLSTKNKDFIKSHNIKLFGDMNNMVIESMDFNKLLNRPPLNQKSVDNDLRYINKTILVTGAAGSIGSHVAKRLLKINYKKLIYLDCSETGIFNLRQTITEEGYDLEKIKFVVSDVSRKEDLEVLFRENDINIIFHAAAYKHVDLMETSAKQLFRNNILGTDLLLEKSQTTHLEKFVLVSTDKAVNPTNLMGASKRICEFLVHLKQKDNSKTDYIITRFGNVLGSNGSVVPIFKNQIEKGIPITITDKNMLRYFMTIPEAADLIIQTIVSEVSQGVFIFDMGEPVKIVDLAKRLIHLYGRGDEQIVEIGLRKGEKLYEELFYTRENLTKTGNEKILISQREFPNIINSELLQKLEFLKENYLSLDSETLRVLVFELINYLGNTVEK